MRTRLGLALALGPAAALACLVPQVNLAGKSCDEDHPCHDGFDCLRGLCQPATARDSGSPPCAVDQHPFCDGLVRYTCSGSEPVVAADCSDAGGCDRTRGCLVRCAGPSGSCPVGAICDRAADLCVPAASCAADAGCPASAPACLGGACLAPSHPEVFVDGGWAPADFSCYAPADAGASTTAVQVTLRGPVVTPAGYRTAGTIGETVQVFLADAFNTGTAPAAFASARVVDGGFPFDGGLSASGVYEVAALVDVPLVAVTEGGSAMPTYQYLRIPPEAAGSGSYDYPLVSYDPATVQDLIAQSGEATGANRALVIGQIFDCRSPPLRVRGATAALSTPGPTFYSFAEVSVLAIDPTATETGTSGRVFFVDVPAIATALVVSPGAPGAPIAAELRAEPGSVTVLLVRPPGR